MKRSSLALIVLAVLGVAAAAWVLFFPRASLPPDLLAVVPGDAIGLMRVRVDRVVASDAYKRLVVERGGARGVQQVQARCGFNPLERVSELVVFARPSPGGGLPRFAFAARGELRHEELLDCVKKFTGSDESSLRYEEIEGIGTIQSKKGTSRAAFIGKDGVLGGDAESVRAAIHALRKLAPSAAQDALLSGLYRDVDQGSDIALVSRFPEEAKPAVRVLARLGGPDLEQLAAIRAFSANLATSGGRLTGGALLVARDAAHAAQLVDLGKRTVSRLLAIPGIGLTPASSVLRAIQMEALADRATFAGSVKVSTIETLLELIPALEQLMNGPPSSAAARGQQPDAGVAPAVTPESPATSAAVDPESESESEAKAVERRERRRARRAAKQAADPEQGDNTPGSDALDDLL